MSIRMPAIGREFGSLDHEQLEQLGKQHSILENPTMGSIETYIKLAERPNISRSYAWAVQYFEVGGRGLLPATSAAIAA